MRWRRLVGEVLEDRCFLSAQVPIRWQPAGFDGAGNFNLVEFDPGVPGVVYAASDVAGVLRSADNGQTWENRSKGLGNLEVDSLAVDPFDSNRLYAAVGAFASS